MNTLFSLLPPLHVLPRGLGKLVNLRDPGQIR